MPARNRLPIERVALQSGKASSSDRDQVISPAAVIMDGVAKRNVRSRVNDGYSPRQPENGRLSNGQTTPKSEAEWMAEVGECRRASG
jgi:hypothetical protein